MTMNLFARITKVDIARQEVIGRAVQEVVDKVDEVFDYASSKPHFAEWSKSFSDATNGTSLGNIRAMHGKTAAGKVVQLDFNDAEKAIDIRTKIVDANEWAKVQEGVYTGFSIGGSYVGDKISEKMDGRDVKRYTAKPSEISLVDNPCIPTAKFFDVIKADGTVEKVAFKLHDPVIEVTGSDEEVAEFAKVLNDGGLALKDAIGVLKGEIAKRATKAKIEDMIGTLDKREFSTEERKSAAKSGDALPDGSFPIKTVGDLENAIRAFGRAKDKAAAKAHIIKRAKALGASDKIPDGWKEGGAKAADGDLKKGMYNVQDFASCLSMCAGIARSAQWDLQDESDGSPVPMQLRNWLADGLGIFKAMATEEADEMLAELKEGAGVGPDDEIESTVEMAVKLGDLRKRLADPKLTLGALLKVAGEYDISVDDVDTMVNQAAAGDNPVARLAEAIITKAGGKMSAANIDRLQAAHDHLSAMGAKCGGGEKAAPSDFEKANAKIEKLTADVEKLMKMPVPHVTLRTVKREEDGPKPTEKANGEEPTPLTLTKDDYVYNPDGSVDYYASQIIKQRKASAEAGNS